MDSPGFSSVTSHRGKWFGPRWEHIEPDMVLRYTPGKTERSTGVEIVADLSLCPMVLEEIAAIPPEARKAR
jgi:hypothetical protein